MKFCVNKKDFESYNFPNCPTPSKYPVIVIEYDEDCGLMGNRQYCRLVYPDASVCTIDRIAGFKEGLKYAP